MDRFLNISPVASSVYHYTNYHFLNEFLKQVKLFEQDIVYPKCEYFKPDRFMGLLRSIESNHEQLLADMKHIISIFILHGPEIQEEEKKTGRAGREFSKFRFKLKRKYRLVRAKVDRRIVDSKSITLGRIAQVFPLLICQGMFRRDFKCVVASSQLTPNYPDVMKTTAFSSLIPRNTGEMLKDVIVKAHRIFLFEFERSTNTKRPEYSLKTKNKIFRLQETRTRGNVIPEAKRLEYCERWNIITRRVIDGGYDVTQAVSDADFYKFFVRPGDPIGQSYPSRIRGGCADYIDDDANFNDETADDSRESNDQIFDNPDYADYIPTESVWIAAKRYDRLFSDVDPKHNKKLPDTLAEAFPIPDSLLQPSTSRKENSRTHRYHPVFSRTEDDINCFPVGQYRENSPPFLVGSSHNINIQRRSSLSDFKSPDVTKVQWGCCGTPTWNKTVEGTDHDAINDNRLRERYVTTQETEHLSLIQSGEESRQEGSTKRRLTYETSEQAAQTANLSTDNESPSTRLVAAGEIQEVEAEKNVSVVAEPITEQLTTERESILTQSKQSAAESRLLSQQSERKSSLKTDDEDGNIQSIDEQILPSQTGIETEETESERLKEQLASDQLDSEDEILNALEEISTDVNQLFTDESPGKIEAANALVQLSKGPRTPPGTPPETPPGTPPKTSVSTETPVPPSTPRTPDMSETSEMLETPSTASKLYKKSKSKSKKKHMNSRQKKKDKTRNKKKNKKKDQSVKTSSGKVQSNVDSGEETETADSDTSCTDKTVKYLAESNETQKDLDEISKRITEMEKKESMKQNERKKEEKAPSFKTDSREKQGKQSNLFSNVDCGETETTNLDTYCGDKSEKYLTKSVETQKDLDVKGNEMVKDKSEITLESLEASFKKLQLFEKKMEENQEKKSAESSSRFDMFQRRMKQYEKEEEEKVANRKFKLQNCNIPVEPMNVQNSSTLNENLVLSNIIITKAETGKKIDNIEAENEAKNDEARKDYFRIGTPTSNKLNTSFHEETGEISDTEGTNNKKEDATKNEDFGYTQVTKNSRKENKKNEDDMNRVQEQETGEKIRKQEKKKKKNRKLPATVENVNLTFMREVIALYCNYEKLESLWATELTYPSEAPEE